MMIDVELIADKIEEVVGTMFTKFNQLRPSATEYSIFYDPKKSSSWIIVIFYTDHFQLKQALKNGNCFQIHSYLLDELKKANEISLIDRTIFFESGARPIEKNDIDKLFNKLLIKLKSLKIDTGKSDIKICSICGHDFNKHQLLFHTETGKIDSTTEGWIICPEENCDCYRTWNFNNKPINSSHEDYVENKKWSWLQKLNNRKKPSA